MNQLQSILEKIKPAIPKRYLLFVAAMAWTFAGGMLLFRGFSSLLLHPEWFYLKMASSMLVGVIFYFVMFWKISLKHSKRIVNIPVKRPCLFSFFSWNSYLLMILMISFGIMTRKSGLIPLEYLSMFYIVMGIPLFLSAFRFYYYGFNYHIIKEKFKKM